MKQLILYFLFFVGAAFIFIQCAKLFPSSNKLPNRPSKTNNNINTERHDKSNKAAFSSPAKSGDLFKIESFNVMGYIKHNPFFNYRNFAFNYVGFDGNVAFYGPYSRLASAQLLSANDNGVRTDDQAVQK
jgi:hypothetical protein